GHHEDVFVGRGQELGRLAGAWSTVRDDIPNRRNASVLLLSGPSGVGKSALLRQFLASDVGQGAVVLRGRCYERESVPYKGLDMLVDSLRAHLHSRQAVLSAVDLPGAGALARIFPVLQDVPGIGDRATVPIEDPLEQRRQAVDALRELWRRLATISPLVIVLDDLQWCDEDTAGVLVDLMRPQHRPPMFFIGAFRSDDAGNPVLGTITSGLGAIDGLQMETLELHPLDMVAATELARSMIGESGGGGSGGDEPDLAQAIATEAEGNLLFIAELARHALSGASSGSPRSGAGSLEAVVVERASHLPEVARRVLEVVATAQSPTAQRVVLAAASVIKGGVEAIAALRTHAFVRTSGPQPDDPIEPFHARIGAAIASSLDPVVQRRHHASLAEELARTEADAEVIAYHLVAAGDPSRALGYLETASVQAMEALAFGRATRVCTMALQHAPAGDPRRLALQHRLADALAFDGRGVQSAEAYIAAAELAAPGEVLEFRRAAAEQLLRCGRLAEGQAELRRVLAALRLHVPTGPKEALAALLALRLKIRLRGTGFVERDEHEIDRSTLLAIDTTFAAATGLLQSNVLFGQYFQAKHLVLALDAGEPHRLARALAMEGLYTATGGTRATVQTDLLNEQLAGLSRRLDDPRSGASSQLAAAVADVYRGRFAEALPRLEHAEEVFRRQCTNVHWEMSMVRMFRVMSLYYLGDLRGMRRVLADALQDASDRDDLSTQLMLRASFQPLLHLFDDDLAAARGAFAALQAEHVASLGTATYRYARMMTLSRIERYAGRGGPAWDAFGEHWAAVRRSLMLTKQPFKIFSVHDRAVGALAAAAQSRGWSRRRLLLRARRDADVLDGERTRWSRAMALPIVASLAAERGNRDDAARIARDAERAFAEGGMQLYRFCMRRRRGECIPGTAGEELIANADAELSGLGVVAPQSLANMLVPAVRWPK
ncbi:MAG: AAA family ATPase, partial [Nannocystaceae bacterium]|nr:AAA family ATPase [Nannocystaceae bacterium]